MNRSNAFNCAWSYRQLKKHQLLLEPVRGPKQPELCLTWIPRVVQDNVLPENFYMKPILIKINEKSDLLPVANVTRSVFMYWTPSTSSNSIYILIAFGRVFSKIDPSSKHASYVGMPFIKAFMDNCIHKGRP